MSVDTLSSLKVLYKHFNVLSLGDNMLWLSECALCAHGAPQCHLYMHTAGKVEKVPSSECWVNRSCSLSFILLCGSILIFLQPCQLCWFRTTCWMFNINNHSVALAEWNQISPRCGARFWYLMEHLIELPCHLVGDPVCDASKFLLRCYESTFPLQLYL